MLDLLPCCCSLICCIVVLSQIRPASFVTGPVFGGYASRPSRKGQRKATIHWGVFFRKKIFLTGQNVLVWPILLPSIFLKRFYQVFFQNDFTKYSPPSPLFLGKIKKGVSRLLFYYSKYRSSMK